MLDTSGPMPSVISIQGKKYNNPTIHSICLQIAWTSSYSPEPLDESHSRWADYMAYSEWFRNRVCKHFRISINTEWKEIYKLVGCLDDIEYPSIEEAKSARKLGRSRRLDYKLTPLMFEEFQKIKFVIVGRT